MNVQERGSLEKKKKDRKNNNIDNQSVQFSSVTESCLTVCDPMNHSTPGLLSITNSQSSHRLMSIELVMPSNHLILCRPHLLVPSIFPSIRVFSNELAICIRWPKYWSFSNSVLVAQSCPTICCRLWPRRRQWQATPVLLPGKSHGRRSQEGCSPWCR